MNRKGFTLVELLAALVILGILVSIGGVAITKTISGSKEKNYKTLVANIKSGVEVYYQECNYGGKTGCSTIISLKKLVDDGYISSNDGNGNLVNPKNDANINTCQIKYSFSGNKIIVEYYSGDTINCPTTNHYAGNY